MSKSDKPLANISTDRARNSLNQPTFAEDTAINGLDTETSEGDIFQIAAYYGESGEYRFLGDKEKLDGLEALEFITSNRMKSAINVWYNLNFDVNVILKGLPEDNLQELRLHSNTTFEDANGKEWDITYIPKKMLEIRVHDGSEVYRHYDVSQFCYTPKLEGAAKEWLGADGKADDNIDVEKFDDMDYVRENWDEIKKYIKVDCKLTAELFEEIRRIGEEHIDPGIPFGQPYSTGYVAADYMRNRLEYKPQFKSAQMQEMAWEAYAGGRFEVFKRGHVGKVYGADINSAYPAIMSELPNPGDLEIEVLGENSPFGEDTVDPSKVRDADYGFVKLRCTTDADRQIQPFTVKNPDEGNRVEYPALEDSEVWTLKEIFEFADDNDYLEEFEILEAALLYETDDVNYPFGFFPNLYEQRKTLEDNDEEKKAKLIKIVMNSMYGKTCQTNLNYERVTKGDAGAPDDKMPSLEDLQEAPHDIVPSPTDDGNYWEKSECGSLFNPFIASYITGLTRLELHKSVVENGLEENTIMLATDCIMVEGDAFEQSDLYDEAEGDADSYADALGGWDYDYVGDAFVVGSGVYGVERTDVDDPDKKYKKSVRGFKELHRSDAKLRDKARNNPDGIPVETKRPITLGEALVSGESLADVGSFIDTAEDDEYNGRTLTASMDTKRRWKRSDPDFIDLLEGVEESDPKRVQGRRIDRPLVGGY